MRSMVILAKVGFFFLILYNEMCEQLENLHNSVSDIFQVTNTCCKPTMNGEMMHSKY